MARQLGAAGGKNRSPAKSNAARANGLKRGQVPEKAVITPPSHQQARRNNHLTIGHLARRFDVICLGYLLRICGMHDDQRYTAKLYLMFWHISALGGAARAA